MVACMLLGGWAWSQGPVPYRVDEYPVSRTVLPPGPGREKVAGYCSACHTAGYIPMQPPLPAKNWAAEVHKMINVYGAQIPPSDADAIIAYLQAHFTPETITTTYRIPASSIGKAVYDKTCITCHQANGLGVPGVFPPIRAEMARLTSTDAGRRYVIHAVLFGLSGRIQVNGDTYRGVMPPWGATLSDDDIAAVLTYLGSSRPVTAAEVAALRQPAESPADVQKERP